MKYFTSTKSKMLLAALTILVIFGAVKSYKYIGRNIASIGFSIFYNKEKIKAFADADVSIHKPVTCNSKIPGNVWLISYAEGRDLYLANQQGLVASSINKCIDFIKIYRKKHIAPEYLEAHKEIFSAKRGAGYWLWKPYLILETLKTIPENDILLYVDSGATIIKPIDSLLDNLIEKDIAFADQIFINKNYTRKTLFQIMGMDYEEAWNSSQANAAFILIKNTQTARDFLAEYLHLAEKPEAIMDSDKSDEYPEFIDHRHDQSILSLLYLKHKDSIKIIDNGELMQHFFHHRRYGWDGISLIFNHEPLTRFEAWFSNKAYKALNSTK